MTKPTKELPVSLFSRPLMAGSWLSLAFLLLVSPVSLHATDYYWDPTSTTPSNGGSGTWDTTTPIWNSPTPGGSLTNWPTSGGDNDAFFWGPAGGTFTVNISPADVFANDIIVGNPGIGLSYEINGPSALSLNGTVPSNIDVTDAGSSLQILTTLNGNSGFRQVGPGRLVLDNQANNLTGGIFVTGGMLTGGTSINQSSNVALRSNDIILGSTATLNSGWSDLSIGGLRGQGNVSLGNFALHQLVLTNVTSKATITAFGLSIQGAAQQTYLGNTTNIFNGATLYGVSTGNGGTTAGLTLGGNAALSSVGRLSLEGGSLVLDNTVSNTTGGFLTDRLNDGARILSVGGTLSLVGNASLGSLENAGPLGLSAGDTTINVVYNGSPSDVIFQFNSLNRSGRATVNFTDTGGTGMLGGPASGSPRVMFGTSPVTTASGFIGPWATVDGGDYAKFSTSRGVFAPDTSSPYDIISSGPSLPTTTAPGLVETLNQLPALTSLVGPHQVQAFRINPSASGQSLDLVKFRLTTQGILLAGTNDYTIYNSLSGGAIQATATASAQALYLGVADANTTLNIQTQIFSSGQDIVKYGDGFVSLLNSNTTSITGPTAFVIEGGTLRATLGPGGSLPNNGLTSVVFRGGVLEINGGSAGTGPAADFTYNLGTGPKTVNWENGGLTDEGGGGFSAFHNAATVNIGGGSATLQWNDHYFVQDGHALVFGSTQATSLLTFENSLSLDGSPSDTYHAREFRVLDNPATPKDFARLSGQVSGSINNDLLKTGKGTLQLTAKHNFYKGDTIIEEGTLQLGANGGTGSGTARLDNTPKIIIDQNATLLLGGNSGNTDRINDTAAIVFKGGTFDTNGYSEYNGSFSAVTPGVGVLTLSASSILDLGDGTLLGVSNTIVAFSNSSDESWTGILNIWNWTGTPTTGGGMDEVYFGGSTLEGLTMAQLGQVNFYSDNGISFLGTASWATSGTGEIVPTSIPEPSSVAAALLLVGGILWKERRRITGLLGSSASSRLVEVTGQKSARTLLN